MKNGNERDDEKQIEQVFKNIDRLQESYFYLLNFCPGRDAIVCLDDQELLTEVRRLMKDAQPKYHRSDEDLKTIHQEALEFIRREIKIKSLLLQRAKTTGASEDPDPSNPEVK